MGLTKKYRLTILIIIGMMTILFSLGARGCPWFSHKDDDDEIITGSSGVPSSPSQITVIFPNGGETWLQTDTQPITWTTTGTIAKVDIQYSTDAGATWTTFVNGSGVNNVSGTNVITVTVPGVTSTACRVRVRDYNDATVYDISDANFTITPGAGSWTALPTSGAPAERKLHTAIWSGTEMIIWGGDGGTVSLDNGARYNLSLNNWMSITTSNAPFARYGHSAIWTGNEMIIWGGFNSGNTPPYLNTGAKYYPISDSWVAITTTNVPSARYYHTAIWTGTEMIIWGGYNGNDLNTGAKYNPTSDSWVTITTTNAPSPRSSHSAVWTGTEMIIWGGYNNTSGSVWFNDGAKYNPNTDTWIPLTTTNAPLARAGHIAIWTGSEMIIWGGRREWGNFLTSGSKYNAASDTWTSISTTGAPSGRRWHTGIWSGTELIIWGGYDDINYLNTGGKYNLQSDTWIPFTLINTPSKRGYHTAIWSGNEMIIWGGWAGPDGTFNTGAKYQP